MTKIEQAIEACECALNCNGHAMCGMLISKAIAALRSIPGPATEPNDHAGAGMSDYVSLLKKAQEIVEAKPSYKRFVDGTPLSNDIAVWMADFAASVNNEQLERENAELRLDAERLKANIVAILDRLQYSSCGICLQTTYSLKKLTDAAIDAARQSCGE